MTETPAKTVTVHYANVECEDGENLRPVSTAEVLELRRAASEKLAVIAGGTR